MDETDEALVTRCRAGQADAWPLLVARYRRLVWAVARRAGLDDHAAADIFQTTFARLVEHLPRIAQPERLQAWIVTTAKREALKALHLGRRTVSLASADDGDSAPPEFDPPDPAPLAEDALAHLQQLDLLRRASDELDARCRDLLGLLFREADDRVEYADIGARLGMPVGSIGPTRTRCLGKLRRLVERHGAATRGSRPAGGADR